MRAKHNDAVVGLDNGKSVGNAFVGRDAQMEFLNARLLSDKDGIEAIAFWGPSGMGKTSSDALVLGGPAGLYLFGFLTGTGPAAACSPGGGSDD